ncbi:site-2 protease family protein [Zooshikella harenae]|uniref:Site-2 protease family protein n=1 Tax=Zooshikella harenae TaxID=2827238 RepID=A0ABS5ZD28_9GAMM|nr:site-2 protease family protein [Zooshikella harenae]MBU2711964.1 site-2 protease family protein [Zooshikella harenae]
MLQLLFHGQIATFILFAISLIIAFTFHEFGHAYAAKYYGDRTAEQLGRVSLSPLAHIDVMGFLMALCVGFGYAKPVPTNPRNFTSPNASLVVAAAGPMMNLLIAVIAINLYMFGVNNGLEIFAGEGPGVFFTGLAILNLIIMVFNLLPIGPLDGHYILPYLLPKKAGIAYQVLNERYGTMLFFGLILLSLAGLPIFHFVWILGQSILPYITFV